MKFSKKADGSKFVVESNWYSMISQKVQNLGYSKKTDGFFEKETWVFWNKLEIANLMSNANEIVRFLKTYKKLGFFQKKGSSWKKFEFFKIHWWWQVCCRMQLRRMQLDLSDFSKTSNSLSCFGKMWVFRKKILNFSKKAGGSNFAV